MGLVPRHRLPPQHPNGSQPQHPYASFLCFSLVLASEILLWRFLSRIFCSSFFSLQRQGEEQASGAGLEILSFQYQESCHASQHKTLSLHLSFISFSLLN